MQDIIVTNNSGKKTGDSEKLFICSYNYEHMGMEGNTDAEILRLITLISDHFRNLPTGRP